MVTANTFPARRTTAARFMRVRLPRYPQPPHSVGRMSMARAVAMRRRGTDVRGHPRNPYRTVSPEWSAVTRMRLKVVIAIAGNSRTTAIHGS